jgi:hypothetical protein
MGALFQDKLSVGRNITLTLNLTVVRSEKLVAEAGAVWEPRGRGTPVVGRRYEATASED